MAALSVAASSSDDRLLLAEPLCAFPDSSALQFTSTRQQPPAISLASILPPFDRPRYRRVGSLIGSSTRNYCSARLGDWNIIRTKAQAQSRIARSDRATDWCLCWLAQVPSRRLSALAHFLGRFWNSLRTSSAYLALSTGVFTRSRGAS